LRLQELGRGELDEDEERGGRAAGPDFGCEARGGEGRDQLGEACFGFGGFWVGEGGLVDLVWPDLVWSGLVRLGVWGWGLGWRDIPLGGMV
jgi:hypothetical protein